MDSDDHGSSATQVVKRSTATTTVYFRPKANIQRSICDKKAKYEAMHILAKRLHEKRKRENVVKYLKYQIGGEER